MLSSVFTLYRCIRAKVYAFALFLSIYMQIMRKKQKNAILNWTFW